MYLGDWEVGRTTFLAGCHTSVKTIKSTKSRISRDLIDPTWAEILDGLMEVVAVSLGSRESCIFGKTDGGVSGDKTIENS